jgi:uncharacterized Zn finger protein
MSNFYVCPTCSAAMNVISTQGDQVTAECMEHGVMDVTSENVFQDSPGQQKLFGGAQ